MTAKNLLLEIGTEELPASFLSPAMEDMERLAREGFSSHRLGHGGIRTCATPRRLVISVSDLAERSEDRNERIVGPPAKVAFGPDGLPTRAAEGFARNNGIPVSELSIEETERGPYVVARKHLAGRPVREILPDLLPRLVLAIPFAKSMRWGDFDVRFARPIRWICALYGKDVIPFEIAGVRAGAESRGHRFASSGSIPASSDLQSFEKALAEKGVILDAHERRRILCAEAEKAAAQVGGAILPDDELAAVNAGLTEWPRAILGSFDRRFLALPRDVLITSMREHQKYFAVVDGKGELLPHFVAITNTLSKRPDIVRSGHERVLSARLSDAEFFYSEDTKRPLEDLVPRLGGVVFHKGLGTLLAKTRRVETGARRICMDIAPELASIVERAAHLAKADLVSGMVGEFPTLQGVMGREYARVSGEDPRVADAIAEHYLPLRAGGDLPASLAGAVLAIADKMDTICATFALGLQPTGAADPYGLRRLALGVMHILERRDISLSLATLIGEALLQIEPHLPIRPGLADEILQFFLRRFHHDLVSRGRDADIIEAATRSGFGDVPDCLARIHALSEARTSPEFEDLSAAFKRVMNILKGFPGGSVSPELLKEDQERDLFNAFLKTEAAVDPLIEARRYPEAMDGLIGLKAPIDRFFDSVMVMVDAPAVRENRLALLWHISRLFLRVGDLSAIQPRQ